MLSRMIAPLADIFMPVELNVNNHESNTCEVQFQNNKRKSVTCFGGFVGMFFLYYFVDISSIF